MTRLYRRVTPKENIGEFRTMTRCSVCAALYPSDMTCDLCRMFGGALSEPQPSAPATELEAPAAPAAEPRAPAGELAEEVAAEPPTAKEVGGGVAPPAELEEGPQAAEEVAAEPRAPAGELAEEVAAEPRAPAGELAEKVAAEPLTAWVLLESDGEEESV